MTSNPRWFLKLLGPWQLLNGGELVHVTLRQQRLITALAILPRQPRPVLAGTLWPDSSEALAAGNLRAAIWCVAHELPNLLASDHDLLRLAGPVSIDVSILLDRLGSFLGHDWSYEPSFLPLLQNSELLPGWYEAWLAPEQDSLRQLRLSVLDALGRGLLAHGDFGHARDSAKIAIAIEPLNESSHNLLIRSFLALGDRSEAVRHYLLFRAMLIDELGIEPSSQFAELVTSR
ncbi:MAG: BTAD domain-containing putative transcriptional regulator [Terrimesophilobacter sp.]